jgi:hypothetical protein
MPFRINNALTNAQMEYNLDHCVNTTIGDEKYQFYCQTQSNLEGGCTRIPSQYLTNGLDCPLMATDAWLDKVYSETGLNCGINCYYYGYGIPSINIPTINIPTFSYNTDYYTTSSSDTGGAVVTPVDTFTPTLGASSASSTTPPSSTLSLASSPPASASASASADAVATIGTGPALSSAQSMSPNMLLLTVFLVSVIALFRRIQ